MTVEQIKMIEDGLRGVVECPRCDSCGATAQALLRMMQLEKDPKCPKCPACNGSGYASNGAGCVTCRRTGYAPKCLCKPGLDGEVIQEVNLACPYHGAKVYIRSEPLQG